MISAALPRTALHRPVPGVRATRGAHLVLDCAGSGGGRALVLQRLCYACVRDRRYMPQDNVDKAEMISERESGRGK